MLKQEQGRKLVSLARQSIETYFSGQNMSMAGFKEFSERQGVFVTLTRHGELRGCIGFPEPTHILYRAVFEAARSAAFEDPRFPAVAKDELDDIEIEVSVLTIPELMKAEKPEDYINMIEIGRDGLIIKAGYNSGLLLPQVPVEWEWDVKEFLKHICIKAGLRQDAWADRANKLYRFQAQIFSEDGPKGDVVEKRF